MCIITHSVCYSFPCCFMIKSNRCENRCKPGMFPPTRGSLPSGSIREIIVLPGGGISARGEAATNRDGLTY